ncbi:HtaA domain-containing protein [Microbacterium sp. SORGH_AS_0888]|uniref:HtaA domain-containing protein n=1 Tax=Microbacterium sp. SORGH_AS_0888 TaxID=3041791 RepID=UPI002787153D|nr:HtaA domain-containing protein [Microbacterium sp. SORGH_AS_0888]MDQ1130131.1 LPXTG-motif cell wall-anchored protein [Microbacterium sp. SORGH_AS_0888]
MHISRKSALRRTLASIVTAALVAAAAVVGVALPAAAASVATVTATQAPRSGGNVTVTGSGFDASGFGIYLSVHADGTSTDTYTVWVDDTNVAASTPQGDTAPMSAAGDFSLSVPVPAYSGAGYSIVTRGAHGIANTTNTTTTPIVYAAAPATATQTSLGVDPATTAAEGADVTLTATVSPADAAGSVEFFAGTASLGTAAVADGSAARTISTLPVGSLSLRAVFTPADAALFAASASEELPFTVTATTAGPVTPTPTLTVSQTAGLDPASSTITVTGVGYDTSAKGLYGPTAGRAAGFYAQIGWLAPTWRPSEGAASSARTNAYSAWVQGVETASPYVKWTDNGDGTASFTWTVTIDKATLDAKKLEGGTLSVFTTGAGGVVQAVNEKSVALSFTEPKITVSSTTLQAGDTVTVSGIGFPAGALATVEIHSDPVTLGTALIGGTGAFSVTGIIPTNLQGTSHTIVVTAPGVSLSAPVTVTAAPVPVVEKVCVAQSVSGATIEWGMKQSFVSYINGPIAKGSISGSWGTGSGAYNTADNRGSVTYSGTVRYTGHSGVLDVSLSQLRVQVDSTTSATLYATTSAGTIAIASLSLPAASVSADRISWSDASASLTSAGSQLFSYNGNAFYPAGTALDPVSFAFPLGVQVSCDGTTNGALAATGGDAPIDLAWIGLAMLVLGVGTLAVRRRARA